MIKRLLIALLSSVVLAVAGLVLFLSSFDVNRYKPQIEALAKQHLGRELHLDGPLSLSLWPIFGLAAEQVSLGNAPGFTDPVFARAERLVLGVALWPLLERRLQVDEIALRGLKLFLERRPDGLANWQLGPSPKAASPAKMAPAASTEAAGFALVLGGLSLEQAEISFRDGVSGEHWRLAPLHLTTGSIEAAQPFALEFSTNLHQAKTGLTGHIQFKARVQVDPRQHTLALSDVHLAGEGIARAQKPGRLAFKAKTDRLMLGGETLALSGTPITIELRFGHGPATLERLEGQISLKLAGELKPVRLGLAPFTAHLHAEGQGLGSQGVHAAMEGEAELDLPAGTARLARLALDAEGLRLRLGGRFERLRDAPRFSGTLELAEFNPRDWLAAHGRPLTGLRADGLVAASAKADIAFGNASLRVGALQARVDDTSIQGWVELGQAGVLADLALDRLDLDRYLPPAPSPAPSQGEATAGAGQGDTPIDLPTAWLRDLHGQVDLRVAQLRARGVDVGALRLLGRARAGEIVIDTLSGQAFAGQFVLRAGLDVRPPTPLWRVGGKVEGVDVGAILQQLAKSDRLRGRGDLVFDLSTRGTFPHALKAGLNGTARAHIYDGTLAGVNIGHLLRRADAALKGQPAPPPEPAQTDFTELAATATISNGVIDNPDLEGKSPLLRVQGGGIIDLPADRIDYALNVTVVNTATGQGGKGLEQLRGVAIPLKVSGSLRDPSYRVDLAKVVEARAKQEVEKRVAEELQQRLGIPAPSATPAQPAPPTPTIPPLPDVLKGLIGR